MWHKSQLLIATLCYTLNIVTTWCYTLTVCDLWKDYFFQILPPLQFLHIIVTLESCSKIWTLKAKCLFFSCCDSPMRATRVCPYLCGSRWRTLSWNGSCVMSCQDVPLWMSPLTKTRFWLPLDQHVSYVNPSDTSALLCFSPHLQSHSPVTQSSHPMLPFYPLFLVGNHFLALCFFFTLNKKDDETIRGDTISI